MPSAWTPIGNIKGPAGATGPAGSPGFSSADTDVIGEVPSGLVNDINRTFTTAANFVTNSLAVYLNGVRQKLPLDYIILSANSFYMASPPETGDLLTVDYLLPASAATPIYVGSKARWVALANGTRLEVQDSGGTWQRQVEYTE